MFVRMLLLLLLLLRSRQLCRAGSDASNWHDLKSSVVSLKYGVVVLTDIPKKSYKNTGNNNHDEEQTSIEQSTVADCLVL